MTLRGDGASLTLGRSGEGIRMCKKSTSSTVEMAKDAIMAFERVLHHFREFTKMVIFVGESGTI